MLIQADARYIPLTDKSCQVCVTSPPYWGLRDYGLEPLVWGGDPQCEHVWGDEQSKRNRWGLDSNASDKQKSNRGNAWEISQGQFCRKCGAWKGVLGLEPTPELYVQHIVEIFREVRRVLRNDGTVFLNLGDSYYGSRKGLYGDGTSHGTEGAKQRTNMGSIGVFNAFSSKNLKPKDLVGIPWRVAFALQADGWYLRRDIIWAKGVSFCPTYSGSSMPESVQDRPSSSHEYVFLLSKSKHYFYDNEAVKEPSVYPNDNRKARANKEQKRFPTEKVAGVREGSATYAKRNLRSVWAINPAGYKGAHYAVFPPALVEPMILAGSAINDIVLDPFCGSGTTGMVAIKHRRNFIGLDLSKKYLHELAQERLDGVQVTLL